MKNNSNLCFFKSIFFSILLIFFCSINLFSSESKKFDNSVLYLLDEQNHTYLFRGKIPQQNGRFCYEELRNQIADYLYENGRSISPDFMLICVSLLNSFADGKECRIESQWFSSHQDKGCLWRYPLFGYMCSPHYIPKRLRNAFYWTDIDGIRNLVVQLKELIDSAYGKDVAIYMHCNAGKDRTGEAAACYLMQFKSYSYCEAMALNQQIAKRDLRLMSINAIRWHAFFLRDICQVSSIGKID